MVDYLNLDSCNRCFKLYFECLLRVLLFYFVDCLCMPSSDVAILRAKLTIL
jgi:hypothetical protein